MVYQGGVKTQQVGFMEDEYGKILEADKCAVEDIYTK